MNANAILVLVAALVVAGCRQQALSTDGQPAQAAPTAETAPEAPAPGAADAAPDANGMGIDAISIPESMASLPPFPFFKVPDGLESQLSDSERSISFDREHMIAGDKVVTLEGKVFRDRFLLANDTRAYTGIEFQRNYANAIKALGGREVSHAQYTNEVNDAFGGREAVDAHFHGICASDGCDNHTWLIRQDGKDYWVLVSTGAIPLHGGVVVLEKEGMRQSLGFLDAAAMKQALDANGHVALQVNFDVDKARLRADASAIIDEISTLLRANPSLRLSIDGHTDNSGSADHNLALSSERAAAVVAALVGNGIQATRLQSRGFGPNQPVADNSAEAGRARNRRVELVKL